ncbi:MAG: hypothetical protein ACI3T9_07175 [Romboutsia timonensis]
MKMKIKELNEQVVTIDSMDANTIIDFFIELSELNGTAELEFRQNELSLSLYENLWDYVGEIKYTISENIINFDLHSTFIKTNQSVNEVFKWAIECYDIFIQKIDKLLGIHELLKNTVDLSKSHIKVLLKRRFSDLRFIFYESDIFIANICFPVSNNNRNKFKLDFDYIKNSKNELVMVG